MIVAFLALKSRLNLCLNKRLLVNSAAPNTNPNHVESQTRLPRLSGLVHLRISKGSKHINLLTRVVILEYLTDTSISIYEFSETVSV
jgi:hypothetical protein